MGLARPSVAQGRRLVGYKAVLYSSFALAKLNGPLQYVLVSSCLIGKALKKPSAPEITDRIAF